MAKVYVSLGSNQDKEYHIGIALDELTEHFGELILSPVYESEAVGFKGDAFLNSVAAFETDLSVADLSQCLKAIEDKHGRLRTGPKFSGRTLDIDILIYDDFVGNFDGVQLPRDEILKNAFVLRPLADIAPELKHPQSQQSYLSLWATYDKKSQVLWNVDFEWRGEKL